VARALTPVSRGALREPGASVLYRPPRARTLMRAHAIVRAVRVDCLLMVCRTGHRVASSAHTIEVPHGCCEPIHWQVQCVLGESWRHKGFGPSVFVQVSTPAHNETKMLGLSEGTCSNWVWFSNDVSELPWVQWWKLMLIFMQVKICGTNL